MMSLRKSLLTHIQTKKAEKVQEAILEEISLIKEKSLAKLRKQSQFKKRKKKVKAPIEKNNTTNMDTKSTENSIINWELDIKKVQSNPYYEYFFKCKGGKNKPRQKIATKQIDSEGENIVIGGKGKIEDGMEMYQEKIKINLEGTPNKRKHKKKKKKKYKSTLKQNNNTSSIIALQKRGQALEKEEEDDWENNNWEIETEAIKDPQNMITKGEGNINSNIMQKSSNAILISEQNNIPQIQEHKNEEDIDMGISRYKVNPQSEDSSRRNENVGGNPHHHIEDNYNYVQERVNFICGRVLGEITEEEDDISNTEEENMGMGMGMGMGINTQHKPILNNNSSGIQEGGQDIFHSHTQNIHILHINKEQGKSTDNIHIDMSKTTSNDLGDIVHDLNMMETDLSDASPHLNLDDGPPFDNASFSQQVTHAHLLSTLTPSTIYIYIYI